jgi:Tfp pilus assembly protein PilN
MTALIDTLTGNLERAGAVAGRSGRALWRVLSLSPADDLISFRKILAVAIDPEGASVSLGRRFLSRIKILDQRRFPAEEEGPPPAEWLASAVAVYLTEKGAIRTDIVLTVPKSWVIIKTADFPAAIRENLSAVVAYEMDRLTPFNPEEVYFDYRLLSEEEDRVRLLVLAARTDRIDPYLAALRAKGLRIAGLTTHLVGLECLSRYAGREGETIFLELREKGYEGGLFRKGAIAASLAGSFYGTGNGEKVEQVLEETAALATGAKTADRSLPVLINLADPNPALKELLKIRLTGPVGFLEETDLRLNLKRTPGVAYSALGGLLSFLWNKAGRVNLLTRGKRTRARTPFWLTVPLLLTLGILTGIYWILPLQLETRRLALIDKQIIQTKGEVKKVETLQKEIEALTRERNMIADFKNSRRMSIVFLKELTVIIPKDSWLTRVRISDNQINIEGYAPSATLLVPKLEASPFFKKVEFASPTYRDPKLNQDRFQIKMEKE